MNSSDSSNPNNDKQALHYEETKAEESQDDHRYNENEEEAPLESFISTTAGGDGLEFDKRLGNIFDEIEAIKQGNQFDPIKNQVGAIPG